MSIKIMTMVWDAFPAAGSELLCMLAMADWANDAGGSLHPSISTIADKIRVSEKQARRIVQNLVNAGYLTVVANAYGGAPGSTKQWLINVNKLKELALQKEAAQAATPPMDGSPTPPMDGSPTPPADGRGTAPTDGRGTAPTGVPDGSHPWEPNHQRTVNKDNKRERAACAQPAIERPTDVDEQTWTDWLHLRKTKRAPVTPTVVDAARAEAAKAHLGLAEFLREWCCRGSQGLKAEWLADKHPAAAARGETFAERDARQKRERWERMTGRQWPDPVPGAMPSPSPIFPVDVIDLPAQAVRIAP